MIGLVAALPLEARALGVAPWRPGELVELRTAGLLVACAGIGARRAGEAARALVERGAAGLVSFGIAGGLDPALGAGTLVLPERVLLGGEAWTCDGPWRARLEASLAGAVPTCTGALLESAEVVVDPAAKAERHRTTGAVAVDMESAGVAAAARAAGRPFLAVRAVSDPAGAALPPAALVAVDPSGRPSYGTFLRSLLRSPGQVVKLFALRRDTRAAEGALRVAASRIGPAFAGE